MIATLGSIYPSGVSGSGVEDEPADVADRYATGKTINVPDLSVTSPSDASVATSRDIQVTGTTTAQRIYIAVNGTKQQVPVTNGAFDATINLPAISNQIVVAAVGADGGTAQVVRNVQAFGERVGGIADPAGDDNGPGSFAPGSSRATALAAVPETGTAASQPRTPTPPTPTPSTSSAAAPRNPSSWIGRRPRR